MKCRRLEVLTFRISNKGRLSGITAKTALNKYTLTLPRRNHTFGVVAELVNL